MQHHLRQQIRQLRQTGSIRDYTSRFQDIIGQITGMGPLDQVMQYIEGLKLSTRAEVTYQAPDTLENAIATAIQYDAAI